MKNAKEYTSNSCLVIGVAIWSLIGGVLFKIISEDSVSFLTRNSLGLLFTFAITGTILLFYGWYNLLKKKKRKKGKQKNDGC